MVTFEVRPRTPTETSLQQLDTPDTALQALRTIKHAVVGARNKKTAYVELGIIPRLVEFLSDPSCSDQIKNEAATVLGSVSYGNKLPPDDAAIVALLNLLSSKDLKLVDSCARALKAIFESTSNVSKDVVFKSNYIAILVSHLSPDTDLGIPQNYLSTKAHIIQVVASIIARIATTTQSQVILSQGGVVPKLVNLLDEVYSPRTQEAAVDALGCLCHDNHLIAKEIVNNSTASGEPAIRAVLRLLRTKRPVTRLLAAACLTNFVRTDVLPPQNHEDVILIVLPTLIELFWEPQPSFSVHNPSSNDSHTTQTTTLTNASSEWAIVQERAPLVFASLVSESERLQKAAMEGDAIIKLASVILGSEKPDVESGPKTLKKSTKSLSNLRKTVVKEVEVQRPLAKSVHADRVREAALVAVAAACSLKEECRKQVIDARLLPVIVTYLSHTTVGLRAAACQCTHSLSRSVKTLRTSLVDAGIALPLLALLSDTSRDVQLTASATLCNLVLDFSPMKTTLLENGGVERLVEMVWLSDVALQLNAIWALKNLLYKAELSVKKQVMKGLTWQGLERLVWHSEIGVQEQALNLLRNLASDRESDIDELFNGFGREKLLSLLDAKLGPSNHDEILTQALTLLRNLAGGVGSERHKSSIMSSDAILRSVLRLMVHPKRDIRGQAIWVVLNLTWRDDTGSFQRVAQLTILGFEEALRNALNDQDLEVRETAKKAIALFNSDGPLSMPPVVDRDSENGTSAFGDMISHLGQDAVGRGW
ncbi:hypothetical protein SmJEL517_g05563 [Synchytrium microbalum]|uniref:Uncharacterized protein n=1 Tax=Synchytrium microbalum TaxID=1806994 RepID=A0A507C0F9_9FUNG|nr:uncharacterized protein SmJEL517_g05563 [Synchytrium microbalum]TPX31023.1 hypothetical protein SmJEL517_g05563 [Synchytrium microbalum]